MRPRERRSTRRSRRRESALGCVHALFGASLQLDLARQALDLSQQILPECLEILLGRDLEGPEQHGELLDPHAGHVLLQQVDLALGCLTRIEPHASRRRVDRQMRHGWDAIVRGDMGANTVAFDDASGESPPSGSADGSRCRAARRPPAEYARRHPLHEECRMTTFTVGYMVGSLAKGSINRKLARALTRLAPSELELREIPIGALPLYSYDYDADYPPAGRALKDAIAGVDAVLFVTPEYNRSIPGALKNAIDWGSRPWGKNSFARASRRR
jgi:hypothetical protein